MCRALSVNSTLTSLDVSNNLLTYRSAVWLAAALGGAPGMDAATLCGTEAGDIAKLTIGKVKGTGPGSSPVKRPPAAAGGKKPAGAGAGAAAPAPVVVPMVDPAVTVAAQLPLVDLKDVVVCGLTTLRCGHNPLSYTGTELLLRSLVANSRLVVLDCRRQQEEGREEGCKGRKGCNGCKGRQGRGWEGQGGAGGQGRGQGRQGREGGRCGCAAAGCGCLAGAAVGRWSR